MDNKPYLTAMLVMFGTENKSHKEWVESKYIFRALIPASMWDTYLNHLLRSGYLKNDDGLRFKLTQKALDYIQGENDD